MSINGGGFQAKPILKGGEVAQLLDPSLGSDYDHDQIERMVLAANLCLRYAPGLRPGISIVSFTFCFYFEIESHSVCWFYIFFPYLFICW